MKIQNILKTIGNSPLIHINLEANNRAKIYAKFEALNPSGSIKDRMALYMLEQAEKNGRVNSDTTIIEATTGNTGIAFSMLAVVKGYKMIAVMPENMSSERRKIMSLLGAKIVLTPSQKGPLGAIERRNQLARKINNSWVPHQFSNIENIKAHELSTGREIVKDLGGNIDVFVAGVGTGGSLLGTAKAIRRVNPKLVVVAVEPSESAVISGNSSGNHNIQGIGEGFIPNLVHLPLIDSVEKVSTKDAILMTKRLIREEGLLVGFSSGANVLAALRIAKTLDNKKTVVTLLPDRAERYLNERGFAE